MKKKIVILMGPPGVGKGTVSQYIKERHEEIEHIAIGSKLRELCLLDSELGIRVKKLIDNGNLLDDESIKDIVESILNDFLFNSIEKTILLLDGFPRNKNQFELFFNFYYKYKDYFNYRIVFLSLVREELKIRLTNRYICGTCDKVYSLLFFNNKQIVLEAFLCEKCNTTLIKRKDDMHDIIDKRLDIYFKEEKNILSFLEKNNISYLLHKDNISLDSLGKLILDYIFE